MTAPRRVDFADGGDYARAVWESGGPSSMDAVWACGRLGGWYGDLLRAVWGDDASAEAEWRAEQRAEANARPHILVEKLPHAPWSSRPCWDATLLSVAEVGEVLSAAEYAAAQGWRFGASLTLSFALMGVAEASRVQVCLKRFLKCFAQWLRDNGLPRSYVGVVENAPTIGLHLHLVAHVPAVLRSVFRSWVEGWVRAECTRWGVVYQTKAWRLNRYGKDYALTHNIVTHYLLKGSDVGAVVQVASEAPDGEEVLLRDVLAFDFCSPGHVPFARLYVGAGICDRARGGWRSKWERGERDVNFLFDAEFVRHVRLRWPVATLSATELSPVARAAVALADWYNRARPLVDALPGEMQAWQTVVERNVELVAAAAARVRAQFALAATMRDPQDRQRAREELCVALDAARGAVNENGEQVARIVDEIELPLGRLAVRRLASAEAAIRELGALLGSDDTTRPLWATRGELDALAI